MLQIHKHHKPALWKMALSLPLIAVLFFVYSCRTGEIVPSQAAKSSANDMYRMGEVVVVGYGTTAIIKNANEKFNKYNLPVPLNTLEEDIYLHVDKAPSPVNGMTDFQKYIQEFVQAGATGKTGTVHVQATINATGNLLNPVVLHGIDAEHDALVLQALQKSNEWNPGKIDGKPVNTRIVIPVPFGKTSTPYTPLSGLKELSKEPTVGKPLPQEGMEAFYKYVQKNLKYPIEARSNLISGQVVVGFTVKKDGTLANIEVVESVFPALDAEVIRVIGESKLLWKPAIENGQAQESRIVWPVTFKLG